MAFGLAKSVTENPAIRMLTALAHGPTLAHIVIDRGRAGRRELLNYYAVAGFSVANGERTRLVSAKSRKAARLCALNRKAPRRVIFPRREIPRAHSAPERRSEREADGSGRCRGKQGKSKYLPRNNSPSPGIIGRNCEKGRPGFPELPRLAATAPHSLRKCVRFLFCGGIHTTSRDQY